MTTTVKRREKGGNNNKQESIILTQDPRRWKALVLLSLAQFLVIMDTSIIGVALPAIQQQFGFSQSELQWIFSAYVIVFGALLLLGGRLSDILRRLTIVSRGGSSASLSRNFKCKICREQPSFMLELSPCSV
jgi:MFS family permease